MHSGRRAARCHARRLQHFHATGAHWELVAIAPVTDYHPPELLEHAAIMQGPAAPLPDLDADEVEEVVPVGAFRYIFKRPLE